MKVFVESKGEDTEITFSGSVQQLLKKLEINPETVIATRNNQLLTEDEALTDKDEIKILSVISGG